MKNLVFESKILPDGHLYCPKELAHKKHINFKVVATFADTDLEASEHEIEISNINDVSGDFLSEKELNYYLNLKVL